MADPQNQAPQGTPGAQPVTPAPQPIGTGAQPFTAPASIPQGLEKFASDGKLDSGKVGQAYLDSERRLRSMESELQKQGKTIEALSSTKPIAPAGSPEQVTEQQLKQFVTDPEGFISDVLGRVSEPVQQQLNTVAIVSAHPEFKDDKFKVGFFEWYDAQPETVRELDKTFDGSDYLIKLYKERVGIKAQASTTPPVSPHVETPTGAKPNYAGVRFSRSAMKSLSLTNPQQYGTLYPEYEKAWREGRVDA